MFCRDKRCYRGINEYADGSVYDGEWRNNEREGTGTLKTRDYEYIGAWRNNKKHGQGKEKFLCGIRGTFVGHFSEGLKEGAGKLELENGYKYEGKYRNDAKHGFGVENTPDGYKYEGFFF